MAERLDIKHGRYRIVCKGGRAVGYLGTFKVVDVVGSDDERAVENAKAAIAKLRADRRSKRVEDVPTADEYDTNRPKG